MGLLNLFLDARSRSAAHANRTVRRRVRPGMESLERRAVLSTMNLYTTQGPTVTGTEGRDMVEIRNDPTGRQAIVTELRNNQWVELGRVNAGVEIRVSLLGGNDVVKNYTGTNRMFAEGGAGDDIIVGGNAADTLWGDSATDHLNVRGNDSITGLGGDDRIYGGPGNDYLNGDGAGNPADRSTYGNDSIYGMQGDDVILGDLGNDTIYGDWQTVWDGSMPTNAARELLNAQGRDKISGGEGDDRIFGGGGDDEIAGHGGNDTISGDGGNDQIYGGLGRDTLIGNLGDDWIYGEGDDDTIYGELGDDFMFGGDGNDTLFGGYGNDHMVGEAGDDTLKGEWGNDRLFGVDGDDTLDGGDGNDSLRGDDGDDILMGQAGDDTIEGGRGDDRMVGGAGSDSFDRRAWFENIDGVANGHDMILTADYRDDYVYDYVYNDGGDGVLRGGEDSIEGTAFAFFYSSIGTNQGFTLGFATGGGFIAGKTIGKGIGFAPDGVFTYESETEFYGAAAGGGVSIELSLATTTTMDAFAGVNEGWNVGVDLIPGFSFSETQWWNDQGQYSGNTLALELGVGLLPISSTYQKQTTKITKLI